MTEAVSVAFRDHLLRDDGQEDICLATYTVSTGARRTTHVLDEVHLPEPGERMVHGNATIMGKYVLRVAGIAKRRGCGVVMLHSHPSSKGWQRLSTQDADTEETYARLAENVTGLPLLGVTLAGDGTWSARTWVDGEPQWARSVRTVGPVLRVNWNDAQVPVRTRSDFQQRTVSAWGEKAHADITRLRVLVVGAGSVGLDVIQRLAATGLNEIGVMDFDHVEPLNLDRMIGATRRDARLRRSKVDVAVRLARRSATASRFVVNPHKEDVCSDAGIADALDYDIIFSCVDRPLPRSVLNTIAYADLIPVIEGGIVIDTFESGGMRSATRRVQTATPGRPCLTCSGQLVPADVALDAAGDLDDPEYIRRAGLESRKSSANVAALAAGVSSGQLDHFVSLVAHPGGLGVPVPLRFILATHVLEHVQSGTASFCPAEEDTAVGDSRHIVTRRRSRSIAVRTDPGAGASWITRAVDTWIDWIESK